MLPQAKKTKAVHHKLLPTWQVSESTFMTERAQKKHKYSEAKCQVDKTPNFQNQSEFGLGSHVLVITEGKNGDEERHGLGLLSVGQVSAKNQPS